MFPPPTPCGAPVALFAGASTSGEATGSRSTVNGGFCAGSCCRTGACSAPACGATGCWGPPLTQPHPLINHPAAPPRGQISLLRRCIVPLAIVHRQRRQPRRWHESYLQFTPVPVLLHIRRSISNHIFVPQLRTDPRRDVPHIRHIRHPKHPSPRHVAHIRQQHRPLLFFRRRRIDVEDPDRIDLHIALPNHPP